MRAGNGSRVVLPASRRRLASPAPCARVSDPACLQPASGLFVASSCFGYAGRILQYLIKTYECNMDPKDV
ncbi:hypothetical protein DY000_02047458 [Brassica cretica]|uniref:Uncharacterized protein n=1 Tax=Brassica cretica TaxID=69181 RepID=A0ABQ7F180_BRACR|nr:hypothetical protein DY000_02047458 [Brassica cretica]